MTDLFFPTIDMKATGENIIRLRKANGLSVRELQRYFGFEEPQAIYKWQQGKSLPSVDNLLALSCLFGVSMNEILVQTPQPDIINNGQSYDCPFGFICLRLRKMTIFPLVHFMALSSYKALSAQIHLFLLDFRDGRHRHMRLLQADQDLPI